MKIILANKLGWFSYAWSCAWFGYHAFNQSWWAVPHLLGISLWAFIIWDNDRLDRKSNRLELIAYRIKSGACPACGRRCDSAEVVFGENGNTYRYSCPEGCNIECIRRELAK